MNSPVPSASGDFGRTSPVTGALFQCPTAYLDDKSPASDASKRLRAAPRPRSKAPHFPENRSSLHCLDSDGVDLL